MWKIFILFFFVFGFIIGNIGIKSFSENLSYNIDKSFKDAEGTAYYIEGTVINKKSIDYSYVQIEFACYDEDGNILGVAFDSTNNFLEHQTWKFKAMALFTDVKSVDHCDYHEITSW